jgi:hypothetical protein
LINPKVSANPAPTIINMYASSGIIIQSACILPPF